MKKKFAKIKNYENAHDTFKYNTERYCQIIAKKYGKDQKQVKEYFSNFFDFIESKGLLTDTIRKRVNKNIKTLIIQVANCNDLAPGTSGLYYSAKNLLVLDRKFNYHKDNVLIHEFTHLLTSDTINVSKDAFVGNIALGKNATNIQTNTGFDKYEISMKLDIDDYFGTFNKSEFEELLTQTVEFVTSDVAQDQRFDVLVRDVKIIPGMIKDEDAFFDMILNDEESDEQTNYDEEKISKIVHKFVNENFKKPNRIAIAINCNTVYDVNYDGKNFYVAAYIFNENQDWTIFKTPGTYLTEGATELLARMYNCKFNNANILSFCGYNMNTKYCELLYRIYGDDFFKAFFAQSADDLKNLMQLDDEEFDNFVTNIDNILTFDSYEIEEFKATHDDIMSTIISCFADHICNDIINNLPVFFNSREIEVAIEKSILEFSSSMYDGACNNINFMSKNIRQSNLTNIYNQCINGLKETIKIDEVAEMLGWEEIAKIDALREGTEKNLQDLFADINFMNDNSYYFTKNNLTQINPTDFAKGKELEIFDNKKQEYLRKKSKFPTVQKGNLFYQKYWEIQTK
ncbi:MAG: hypothetical protein MR024_02510 [Firmicutes bacterium]|nr:hypothetical protein [Bacillota bacterium]